MPVSPAMLVSNLCLLGALLFLYKLTVFEFGDTGTARRAVFYIACFPTAFYFSTMYTESAFLLFSVATMYFARRHLWVWAGVMGMLTSATRIVGVAMAGIVLLEWLRVHGWTISTCYRKAAWVGLWQGLRQDRASLLPIALIPLGILSYMVFLKVQFNDPRGLLDCTGCVAAGEPGADRHCLAGHERPVGAGLPGRRKSGGMWL